MIIGTITKIERGTSARSSKIVTVEMPDGSSDWFSASPSIVHGYPLSVGLRLSLRYSRDNSRVVSVVPAAP